VATLSLTKKPLATSIPPLIFKIPTWDKPPVRRILPPELTLIVPKLVKKPEGIVKVAPEKTFTISSELILPNAQVVSVVILIVLAASASRIKLL
jgi:hypothetical protein